MSKISSRNVRMLQRTVQWDNRGLFLNCVPIAKKGAVEERNGEGFESVKVYHSRDFVDCALQLHLFHNRSAIGITKHNSKTDSRNAFCFVLWVIRPSKCSLHILIITELLRVVRYPIFTVKRERQTIGNGLSTAEWWYFIKRTTYRKPRMDVLFDGNRIAVESVSEELQLHHVSVCTGSIFSYTKNNTWRRCRRATLSYSFTN